MRKTRVSVLDGAKHGTEKYLTAAECREFRAERAERRLAQECKRLERLREKWNAESETYVASSSHALEGKAPLTT